MVQHPRCCRPPGWPRSCGCWDGRLVAQRSDELGDGGHDRLLLLDRYLRVDGDGDRLAGRPLGVRKGAADVAEIGEARLQVERRGIVDLVADAAAVEKRL